MPDLAIKRQDKRIGHLVNARAAAERKTEKDKEEGRGAHAEEEESEGVKGSEAQGEGEGGGEGKSGALPPVEAVAAAASPTGKKEADSVEDGEGEKHTAHTVLEGAEAVTEGLEEAAGRGEEGKAVAKADHQGAMDESGAAASSSSTVGQEACPRAARGECKIDEEPAAGGPGRCDGDGGDGDAGADVRDADGEAATRKMQKKKKSAKKKK